MLLQIRIQSVAEFKGIRRFAHLALCEQGREATELTVIRQLREKVVQSVARIYNFGNGTRATSSMAHLRYPLPHDKRISCLDSYGTR